MNIFLSEMVGTMLLILLGDGVVANVVLKQTKGGSSGWIVITAGWGFAVTVAVYAVGWVSGAHLNPAVTLAVWLQGGIPASVVPVYFIGQLVGAFLGAILVWLTYKRHYDVSDDKGLILATFCTGPAIRDYKWNLVTEIIGTAMLTFGVLAIFNSHNGIAGGFGPYAVGVLVWSIGLSLGGPTGYAINPARDLGPRLAHALLPIKNKGGSDWGYAWVPIVGPLIGGAAGSLLYSILIPVFTTH
ncbi:MIP/aquaporin family protein [Pantoea cypripedii]|uniref:Aquaporin n=1 Tax=Pantoea cypripedii TaxID=55209 RepID=A0A1X1EV39_PANCY|nr:MIP/aquaporin family protein [Pantoea cypripedii]MBP2198025.1 glycerol uptake facilitator protein [Pantoea cypripedii]ORM93876.1 aquaporin [Pantoea cypripedii]